MMMMWLWHIARHYSSGTTEKTHEKPQQENFPCSRLTFWRWNYFFNFSKPCI